MNLLCETVQKTWRKLYMSPLYLLMLEEVLAGMTR
jgi:hypothetical protein